MWYIRRTICRQTFGWSLFLSKYRNLKTILQFEIKWYISNKKGFDRLARNLLSTSIIVPERFNDTEVIWYCTYQTWCLYKECSFGFCSFADNRQKYSLRNAITSTLNRPNDCRIRLGRFIAHAGTCENGRAFLVITRSTETKPWTSSFNPASR